MKAAELNLISNQALKDINEKVPQFILVELDHILKNVASKGQKTYDYYHSTFNDYSSVRKKVIASLKRDGFIVDWQKTNPNYITISWE